MPPESIRAGKMIAGKYRIESLLGTGAMGTVWIATHVNLGSKVAVKLVSPEFARSAEARTRFLAEAKAAASLRSRYVVQMFDSGVTDGAPYIVMEYLRGESLEDRIQRTGRIPLEQVVRIVGQVTKGLERAHSCNIVHRDLKPANIFLASTEDGEEVAKILDFGIAKMEHEDKDYKATATGVIMGTPLFMSPEQARGLKSVDSTSDVYSLGMVTYAATVGDVPFHAESFGDLVYMVCTQDLPPTQTTAPWLPPTMDAWFRKACHKEQAQRFATVQQAYEALVMAAELSRPSLELGSLSDTGRIAGADTALFDAGGSRITGKVRTSATAASTVPFSSADDVSASWGERASGSLPISEGRAPTTTKSPGAGTLQIAADTHDGALVASDMPTTQVPKRSRKGWLVAGAVAVAGAVGALVWAVRPEEPVAAEPVRGENPTNPTSTRTVADAPPVVQPESPGKRPAPSPAPASPQIEKVATTAVNDDEPEAASRPKDPTPTASAKPKKYVKPKSTTKAATAKPRPKPTPAPQPKPKPTPKTGGTIDLGF